MALEIFFPSFLSKVFPKDFISSRATFPPFLKANENTLTRLLTGLSRWHWWWRTYLPMQETVEMWVWSLCQENSLEESMATHSSILAWRIPWTKEPSRLQSMGSQRVGHDWSDLACMQAPNRFLKALPPQISNLWLLANSNYYSKVQYSYPLVSSCFIELWGFFSNMCPLKFYYSSPRGATTTAWTGQGYKAWKLYKDFNYYNKTNLDSILKSRYIILLAKVCIAKAMVFPVVMSGCESWTHKEGWALKKWCFWTVVLEKTLENPLDCEEIKPVNPKGNQSWMFIGRDCCWSWHSRPLATWCKELTLWKRPWCWEGLKAKGEGGGKGWDG